VETASLDAAVLTVASNAREGLLARMLDDLAAAAPDWLAAACEHKGLDPSSPEAGEELVAGVGPIARLTQELRRSLVEIDRRGRPTIPGPARHVPGGRVAVGVVPRGGLDRIVLARQRGEVWMQPGISLEEVEFGQAAAYREPEAHRGVSLVLGAGNVASSRARPSCSRPTR
jgi:aldehyde dehydrogenase (NAD(P)+)